MNENERCSNCVFRARLIMWEEKDGHYFPNYNRPLTCCTALVNLDDGSNTVYGHTKTNYDGMCEMFVMRGEE